MLNRFKENSKVNPAKKAIYNFTIPITFWDFFVRFYLFTFRERGREGEKHRCVRDQLSLMPPSGDLARNPGMCPDWESNQRPVSVQAGTQSIEPHQPGHLRGYFNHVQLTHLLQEDHDSAS